MPWADNDVGMPATIALLDFGNAAYPEIQKFKLTARLQSLLLVELRLQCGREFDQRYPRCA